MTWATSVPILVFLGFSRLRPDVRDRRTSDAHHRSMPPTIGAVHNNNKNNSVAVWGRGSKTCLGAYLDKRCSKSIHFQFGPQYRVLKDLVQNTDLSTKIFVNLEHKNR